MSTSTATFLLILVATALAATANAQEPPGLPPPPGGEAPFGRPGPRGMGPMTAERELIGRFDADGSGKLDRAERQAARALIAEERASGRGGPGFGPGGGGRRGPGGPEREPARPGPELDPADVPASPDAPLYEPTVLRTIFLVFEHADWEDELADFYRSDVEVPAKLIVDGKEYPGVGVHFRGASSYFAVPKGYKRSLNVSLDFTDPKQNLYGYKTLNLLNAHGDPSFASTVLYSEIARRYVPAPRANLVRVAINGEYWGVYTSAQQFDQRFLTDNYATNRGARWKVKGSPGGDGGLSYVGEDVAEYRRRYEIKSKDDAKDWRALIDLCRTLSETPLDELEAALQPMLDIDGVLWFLALDNALINSDGYWIRASDYCLYRDPKGVFHVVPHDMNEAFRPAMGPGMRGPRGPAGGAPGQGDPMSPPGDRPERAPARPQSVDLDPLVGLNDARKPLRSRLLAVPSLRDRYLLKVRTIAAESLDWQWLGARVAAYRELIDEAVAAETRQLTPYEAFRRAIADGTRTGDTPPGERRPSLGLRSFADQRRAYLLAHPEIEAAAEAGKRP